jgi:hypothetical protein
VAAGGSSPKDQTGSLLLATLLGVLVVAGVGGIALLAGRRRAEEEPAGPALAPEATSPSPVVTDEAATAAFAARVNPPPSTPEPAPRPASWEAYADINDRPIGTVDELPPGDYQRRPHDGSS